MRHWNIAMLIHSCIVFSCIHATVQFSSVTQLCPMLCDLKHARPPCPSPTPRVYSNSCPLSRWCHPTISSSVVPFSSCPECFPASGSFQMSQLFAWGGQSIGVSASIHATMAELRAEVSGCNRDHIAYRECIVCPLLGKSLLISAFVNFIPF